MTYGGEQRPGDGSSPGSAGPPQPQPQPGAGPPQAPGASPYAQQPPYAPQPPYEQAAPYGQQPPYPQQPPYMQQPPYGQQPPYEQAAPYGQQPAYWAPPYATPQPGYVPPPLKSGNGAIIAIVAVATAFVLLICGGAGVVLLLTGGDEPKNGVASPAPSTTAEPPAESPSASQGPSADISSRVTDPVPLTVAELFPNPTVFFNGSTYAVLGTDEATNCRMAADGKVSDAVVVSGCSQVVRATVKDPTSQYLVTVGVANLPDEAAANEIFELLSDPTGNGYFTRLNGTGLASGFEAERDTIVGSLTRGHYIIFAVGGRADTKEASLADERLKAALKDMRLYANEVIDRRAFN